MYSEHGPYKRIQNFREWCKDLRQYIKESKLSSKTKESFLKTISRRYKITYPKTLLRIHWDGSDLSKKP